MILGCDFHARYQRIANRVVSSGAISYYAEDFIGSSRVITTSLGATCYDADFYPYGSESNVTNTCPQNYKWTGKERDAETGNDDFDARYYSSVYGRFLSADWSAVPVAVPYANLTNPQTLNLYAIVRDNPESFADLDGHEAVLGPAACGAEGCGTNTNAEAQDQKKVEQQNQSAQQNQTQHTITVNRYEGLGGNPLGHVGISIDGKPAVGYDTQKDLSKSDVAKELADSKKSTPAAVKAVDPDRKSIDSATIHVTAAQAKAAQDYVNSTAANPGNYQLKTNNCAEFAEHALGAAGLKSPSDMTPRGLVSDLKQLYPQ